MAKPRIIAVASGKGGVGKSLLTANLAIALAQSGRRTIAVDLDLGGSNLHSYLGLPNKHPGVGDYLVAKHGRLEDYLVETGVENLQFIPGDGRTPCMANIEFSEKVRLLLAIRWLKADVVLLDLSGGSDHNTLDFFALAPHGLLVTTLEYPSIMNFLVFLRNFVFRCFDRDLRNFAGLPEMMREFRRAPMSEGQLTTAGMLERIRAHNPKAAEKAEALLAKYRPRVIYNFCLLPEQLRVCHKVDQSARQILGLPLEHFACVFEDRTAREAAYRTVPLMTHYPDSAIATQIRAAAAGVADRWEEERPDSAADLNREALRAYEALRGPA